MSCVVCVVCDLVPCSEPIGKRILVPLVTGIESNDAFVGSLAGPLPIALTESKEPEAGGIASGQVSVTAGPSAECGLHLVRQSSSSSPPRFLRVLLGLGPKRVLKIRPLPLVPRARSALSSLTIVLPQFPLASGATDSGSVGL